MRRNILPWRSWYWPVRKQPYGADRERAIADGRRLYGCRRRLRAGRGRGRFPAERQGAFFVLSPRIPIPHPRYAILQTSEIVER
jgi:hypothetical protein